MSALGQVRERSMRLRAAVLLGALVAFAAHLAVTLARTETLDPVVLAVDSALAVLLLIAAYVHLHGLARERQRHVMSMVLLELTGEPRRIDATAGRALELIVGGGLAQAGVLGIARGGDWLPVAAYGYPEGWLDAAPRAPRAPAPVAPISLDDPAEHPWGAPLPDVLGGRTRGVLVPVVVGDEPIGLLLLAARRMGPLRDGVTLSLTGRAVGAALHHAELYEAAYEREQALEAQSARRREVFAMLAEEVRRPMSSIASLAELAAAVPIGVTEYAARSRLLASLARGVERLEQLVNELLADDGDGPDGPHPVPEIVDVAGAVRLAEAVLRPAFMLGEQSLTLEFPEGPVAAFVDPRHLEQVALNLLSNANRRTPMGGRVHVRLSRPDERTTRIEFEDSGSPLAEEERLRVFEPGGGGASGVSGELGLGVAHRLIALQHGRIWVEDTPDGGARFCVELPAPPSAAARAVVGG